MTAPQAGSELPSATSTASPGGAREAARARRDGWRVAQPDPELIRRLVQSERLPEVLARLVVNRGHTDPKAVQDLLTPSLHFLHDPAGLPQMAEAAERFHRAVEDGETILIHGDYDVDGVSGTVLLVRLAEALGAKAEWHIPHRTRDGYSFGDHSVAKAKEVGASLVVSVDNGTSAFEPITQLSDQGIDVIVTDHHEPPDGDLPPTFALVNPKLPGHDYPFRELCGSAVAFKLAWSVCQRVSGSDKVRPDLRAFLLEALGYVAVATICDVVPLVGENRVLAHFGLRALRDSPAPGMLALLERTGLAGRDLTPEDVGYQIGPRINASGRMDSAARAVEAMLAADAPEGRRCAEALEVLNDSRRAVERGVLEEALTQAKELAERGDRILVLGGEGWHPGVVGIVASRLVDRFDRPALVIGVDEHGVGRGSARSVDGVSVLEIMKAGADHMNRFGGHAMAAGCEVSRENLPHLREALVAAAAGLEREDEGKVIEIDARIRLEGLDDGLMTQIRRLEPCGEKNPKPVLLAEDVRLDDMPRIIGQDRSHMLLKLRSGTAVFKALAFGMAKREPELSMGRPLDVVFTPRISHWRGRSEIELVLEDFASR